MAEDIIGKQGVVILFIFSNLNLKYNPNPRTMQLRR